MKVIKCNTPNGQFQIPLKLVAENRANYYAKKDGVEIGSQDYKEEVDWVMEDDFEGIDWLLNNTNWEDWQDSVTKLNDKVQVTDDDFWCSGDDFEIIEAQD